MNRTNDYFYVFFLVICLIIVLWVGIGNIKYIKDKKLYNLVILCGGGSIPIQAIDLAKENAVYDKCLVISCYPGQKDRWLNHFEHIKFILAENLTEKDLDRVGILILEGGDQWIYLNKLNPEVINEAYRRGIIILGTSSGSMILSEYCFSAENGSISSFEAMEDKNVCLSNKFISIKCLENVIIDVHYTERNRENRLKVFMEKSGAKKGIGIDEGTCIAIDNKGYKIFGLGTVSVINKGE